MIFQKFEFAIISQKNYNLAKSRNFRSGNEALEVESPQRLAILENMLLK